MKNAVSFLPLFVIVCLLFSCRDVQTLPSPNGIRADQIELNFEITGPESEGIPYGSVFLVFSAEAYGMLPDSFTGQKIIAPITLGSADLGIDRDMVEAKDAKVYFYVRALPNADFGISDTLSNRRQGVFSYTLKNNKPKAHSIKVKLSKE